MGDIDEYFSVFFVSVLTFSWERDGQHHVQLVTLLVCEEVTGGTRAMSRILRPSPEALCVQSTCVGCGTAAVFTYYPVTYFSVDLESDMNRCT